MEGGGGCGRGRAVGVEGHFEVQMFLSHALLSEAVGCVGFVV